jgi:hypothetical protein
MDSSQMVHVDVAIPEGLAQFVADRARVLGHASAGDYIRMLIEAEQRRLAESQLEVAVREALEGEAATPLTKSDWDSVRREVRKRAAET